MLTRMLYRFFCLNNPGKLQWRTYLWTALSGGCFSGSSLVLLVLIVRLLGKHGAYWGGVFSIALAISQQLITIGLFQMRPYQVSDIDETFSFSDYFVSRVSSVAIMLIAGLGWILTGGMGPEKNIALFLLLAMRAGESFSDVFEGRYQQFGRLDIASKGHFFKTLLPLVLFGVMLWIKRDMLIALTWMVIFYWVLLFVMDGALIRLFARLNIKEALKKQRSLLLACLPLATNAFLLIYANNLSKYAIDRLLDEQKMAEYNALFMPSFLISLLSGFALRPVLTKLSLQRKSKDQKGFHQGILIQFLWIVFVTVPTLVLAYLWGTPVLSLLYGMELTPYRNVLCVLIGGGALLAIYYVLQSVLIILRRQFSCLVGVFFTAAVGQAFTPSLVRHYGIVGGAYSFLFTTLLLSIVFTAMTVWYTQIDLSERIIKNGNSE